MGVNKVDAFGENLIDLTEDTVQESDLPQGVTAHNASGERIVGTTNYVPVSRITFGNASYGWLRCFYIDGGIRNASMVINIVRKGNGNQGQANQIAVTMNLNSGLSNSIKFTDICSTGERYIPSVRFYLSEGTPFFDIDLSYPNPDWYIVEVFNFTSEGGQLKMLNTPTFLTEEFSTPFVHELNTNGLIADRAIADQSGNNLEENYIHYGYNGDVNLKIGKSIIERLYVGGPNAIGIDYYFGNNLNRMGGIGALCNGVDENLDHFYMGFGNAPWSLDAGFYVTMNDGPHWKGEKVDVAGHLSLTNLEITTYDMLNEKLNELYQNQEAESVVYCKLGVAVNTPIGGSSGIVMSYKANKNYGFQKVDTYDFYYYKRCINNGVWSEWRQIEEK